MAQRNRATLKGYFNTGDTPTEAQFVDLIDSSPNPSDDGVVQIQPSEGPFANGDKAKLDGISPGAQVNTVASVAGQTGAISAGALRTALNVENGATADQTGPEIKAAYEGEANTNAFTDAEKSKLAGLEGSKYLGTYTTLVALETAHPSPAIGSYGHVDAGAGSDVQVYVWDDDGSSYVLMGSGGSETGASIKTKYEGEPDTNAFTDAEKAKLSGVEANATADQSGAEIKTAYESQANTNAFTDAEKSKLGAIEAGADVTDAANVAAAGGVLSDPSGVTGADAITNIMSLTQAEYDAIGTPVATTLYVITDA